MSVALDEVRDECANGRLSPNVVAVLEELDERVRALEPAPADETPKGGE